MVNDELLVTLQPNWKQQVLLGLLLVVPLIALNLFAPQLTSIGFPVALSFATSFIPAVVFAPVVEELLFRVGMLNFLYRIGLPVVAAVLIQAAAFMAFHFAAYEESFSAQSASFVGAFVFGVAAGFAAVKTRSFIIPVVLHATFNAWLLVRLYLV